MCCDRVVLRAEIAQRDDRDTVPSRTMPSPAQIWSRAPANRYDATGDGTSARHWDLGVGRHLDCSHSTNVRAIGDRFAVSWNDALCPPPRPTDAQVRTLSRGARGAKPISLDAESYSWGPEACSTPPPASGLCYLTMDFDIVEARNLDRLIGAHARLRRPKITLHTGKRQQLPPTHSFEVSDWSICVQLALDHDLIFSCVDRPWRAVLNPLRLDLQSTMMGRCETGAHM